MTSQHDKARRWQPRFRLGHVAWVVTSIAAGLAYWQWSDCERFEWAQSDLYSWWPEPISDQLLESVTVGWGTLIAIAIVHAIVAKFRKLS